MLLIAESTFMGVYCLTDNPATNSGMKVGEQYAEVKWAAVGVGRSLSTAGYQT